MNPTKNCSWRPWVAEEEVGVAGADEAIDEKVDVAGAEEGEEDPHHHHHHLQQIPKVSTKKNIRQMEMGCHSEITVSIPF